LFRLWSRDTLETRHELQHLFGAHPRAAAGGDGPAGGDETDPWKLVLGPGVDAAYGTEHEGCDDDGSNVGFLEETRREIYYTVFARCW